MTELLARLEQLQQRAVLAEARSGVKLFEARYTSTRQIQIVRPDGTVERFDNFAVSFPKDGATTDLILCRTPELAKFIALLLSVGDEIVPIVANALRSDLPREG